jgi:hypothetical protein
MPARNTQFILQTIYKQIIAYFVTIILSSILAPFSPEWLVKFIERYHLTILGVLMTLLVVLLLILKHNSSKLYYKNNSYWKSSNHDGPFCQNCYDDRRKTIHLINTKGSNYGKCPACKTGVNYTDEPDPTPSIGKSPLNLPTF